jgi:hypothetical protein
MKDKLKGEIMIRLLKPLGRSKASIELLEGNMTGNMKKPNDKHDLGPWFYMLEIL